MIERLEVRGMGGITSADLDFSGDFIVITGESGSGKSSLVRAFEFISGKRAATTSIHAGCDETEVTALWGAPGGGEAITKRSLSRSGKGRCWIGEDLATAGTLAVYSSPMIEIQSQFAQLNLLDGSRQLELVDLCGGGELLSCRDRLADIFPQMISVEREIIELKKRRAELEAKLEGAPERVRRIKALGVYPDCENEWKSELDSLERSLAEAGKYEHIIYRMKGSEAEDDLLDTLASLLRELYSAAPSAVSARWNELGERGLSCLQELFDSAKRELGMTPREEIEKAHDKAEARLGLLRKLKRETGLVSADALTAYIKDVEDDTKWLAESGAILDEKSALSGRLKAEVASAAKNLRSLREKSGQSFEKLVNRHLRDRAMDDINFSVNVNKLDKVRSSGAESVTFMLSQKSLPPNPVGRVASGGELSRILIAIQASIGPDRLPGVLVFDEVEAGLGGRTALLAGEKLRDLSKNCRTILITHEATIAAMADQHFVVTRTRDETEVYEISGDARAREIARMLAGSESREAMEHARALLDA
ncbi:MAG: AAA family ATPase [Synergistaceae bacterium]|jgi:DNA repair protein RecN (Recombination protein N)|nr:AAA family ATPase [Synergistaceae bacterium]